MFSSGPNYTKLKTHLRLALNRTKLLEKKKTELTQKARKEIGDYLATGKIERARIRVEHIIREDYLVEAMEIVEMYCDLLLARFGLVTQMTELDDGIAEAVSSIVWVSPRLQTDIQELKIISDIFITKYGKPFAEQARTATGGHRVSEKLMHKLAIQAPPKLLVEKYLIEIAKNYNIEYEPDPQVMKDDQRGIDGCLIDLSTGNNLDGSGTGQPPQMGFIGYPTPPALPDMPHPPTHKPFNYPPPPPGGGGNGNGGGMGVAPPPFAYNIPPNPPGTSQPPYPEFKDLNINSNFIQEEKNSIPPSPNNSGSPDDNFQKEQNFDSLPPKYSSVITNDNLQKSNKPKPQPRSKIPPEMGGATAPMEFPMLPNVPSDLPDPDPKESDEIDFDDLSRRFEELKKRK